MNDSEEKNRKFSEESDFSDEELSEFLDDFAGSDNQGKSISNEDSSDRSVRGEENSPENSSEKGSEKSSAVSSGKGRKFISGNGFRIAVGILAAVLAVLAMILFAMGAGNSASDISYEEFEENYTIQAKISNKTFSVRKSKSNSDKKYEYDIYEFMSSIDDDSVPLFTVESDKNIKLSTVQGTEYSIIISYPGMEDAVIKSLYDTEVGHSYTEDEWESYMKNDYSKEIRKYYDDVICQ